MFEVDFFRTESIHQEVTIDQNANMVFNVTAKTRSTKKILSTHRIREKAMVPSGQSVPPKSLRRKRSETKTPMMTTITIPPLLMMNPKLT